MHASNRTITRGKPPAGATDQKLWYVPDRRIRTCVAARRATEIAEWTRTDRALEVIPNEHALFAALHTCAFRAKRSMLMNPAQRKQWARRWRLIREHIIKANLGLAHTMLHRFSYSIYDEDARISEAMYGLARAVERFNPWQGCRFSTYACNVIARGLMRCYKRERRHREVFTVQFEGSFERPSPRVDHATALMVERLRYAILNNLASLSKTEARVLDQRFLKSSVDKKRATFSEIGNAIGLSKERVRQIQNVALEKLRDFLQADPILL